MNFSIQDYNVIAVLSCTLAIWGGVLIRKLVKHFSRSPLEKALRRINKRPADLISLHLDYITLRDYLWRNTLVGGLSKIETICNIERRHHFDSSFSPGITLASRNRGEVKDWPVLMQALMVDWIEFAIIPNEGLKLLGAYPFRATRTLEEIKRLERERLDPPSYAQSRHQPSEAPAAPGVVVRTVVETSPPVKSRFDRVLEEDL